MNEETRFNEAIALLREIRSHRGAPFDRGNAYISRDYADQDVLIGRRIQNFLTRIDAKADQEGGDDGSE